MYGDMGRHGGAQGLSALISEVASESYTAILHVGDFAYDLDGDGGVVSMMSLCYYVIGYFGRLYGDTYLA